MRLSFWQYVLQNLPFLLEGLKITCILFCVVILIALPLSVIFAVLKVSGPKWLKVILNLYTWIFRGTPLILQLFLVYYGFPQIGIVLDSWTIAIVVFSLSVASYETEIIRGGIISIDKGQYEACHALGMTYLQTMRRVVIPQTVRRVLPTTCSEMIILFKDTSLVTAVALFDMMRSAQKLVVTDMRIDAFIVVLFIYLLVSSLIVRLFSMLEKRFSVSL